MALSHFFPYRSRTNYRDVWQWPERLLNQHFNIDLNDWSDTFDTSLISRNRKSQIERRSSTSEVFDDKNKFRVNLDVSHFKPEEINVKIVDKFIVINGKHEEVMDQHGWVSRQFTRKYALPEECDPEKVTSTISSDGLLTIDAPKIVLEQLADNERVVPITVLNETSPITITDSK